MQYFVSHEFAYNNGDDLIREEHVFACVCWKHAHFDWYGVSATVCVNMFVSTSLGVDVPIQYCLLTSLNLCSLPAPYHCSVDICTKGTQQLSHDKYVLYMLFSKQRCSQYFACT